MTYEYEWVVLFLGEVGADVVDAHELEDHLFALAVFELLLDARSQAPADRRGDLGTK